MFIIFLSIFLSVFIVLIMLFALKMVEMVQASSSDDFPTAQEMIERQTKTPYQNSREDIQPSTVSLHHDSHSREEFGQQARCTSQHSREDIEQPIKISNHDSREEIGPQAPGARHDSQSESTALVHFITPAKRTRLFYLSILRSFLSGLPSSTWELWIKFDVPSRFTDEDPAWISSKLSHVSLEHQHLEETVDGDRVCVASLVISLGGAASPPPVVDSTAHSFSDSSLGSIFDSPFNPYPTINSRTDSSINLSVGSSANSADLPREVEHLTTWTFRLLPEYRSEAIFVPIALYSDTEQRFVPFRDDESSSLPSPRSNAAAIIQLSASPVRGVIRSPFSHIPIELLSIIFAFLEVGDSLLGHYTGSTLSDVCKLWREAAAPYGNEPGSVKEKYDRVQLNPGAGRLWNTLWLQGRSNVEMVKVEIVKVEMVKTVIDASPHVTRVYLDACWDSEEAKTVLHAISGLRGLVEVTFGSEGRRKWKKDEVENFIHRMRGTLRHLTAYKVEDSASSPSARSYRLSIISWLGIPSTSNVPNS
ncbi:hypothetical protein BT69DRAFT_113963 [Atractiella rhizophila]|nr:hypothetical protein BT69DRAFT_113963 [Atractiella rhizophila]